MASLFPRAFACPTPFRSALLPLCDPASGDRPLIACYHAEPQNSGREMLLTRYEKRLLDRHDIDDVASEELGVKPLVEAVDLIRNATEAAGLSFETGTDQALADSWQTNSAGLTGAATELPAGLEFLAGVPLLIDALAMHDLAPQKHAGVQRVVNGRPTGTGTIRAAVLQRVKDIQQGRPARLQPNADQITAPAKPLALKPEAKADDWIYTARTKDSLKPKPSYTECATFYMEIDSGSGFKGIQLRERQRWIWEPTELIPVAIIMHNEIWDRIKPCVLTEQQVNIFFAELDTLSEADRKARIQNHGNLRSDYWHWLYAKNAFDKLRADAEAEANVAIPRLKPRRPDRAIAVKLPGGKIAELET